MRLQVSCTESIKKRRKITTTKNQIQSWPSIYKPGEHRQQSKGKKTHKITSPMSSTECEWRNFESVATHPQYWSRVVRVSSTNSIPYASDAMVGRCCSTMRRLDNLKRYTYRPCIFAILNFEGNMTGIEETN